MPGPSLLVDERLKEFATARQIEFIDAVNKHHSMRKAAREFGIASSVISESISRLKKRAAILGYSPEHDLTRPVAPGQKLRGASHLYKRGEAEPVLSWVKSTADDEAREAMQRAAFEAMASEMPRLSALPSPISGGNSNLCNCYVITDFHLNALSWHEETGASWDVKIAEKAMIDWFAQAIAQSPAAGTAVFAQLSDLLHSDGLEPLTPASKHVLDVDTRFQKVVRIVIRVIRQVIDMLLVKHPRVHVLMADANHDPVSQIWLREWLSVIYENEPRITVDRDPSPYNSFEFGKVALFFHHGHKRKVTNVSEVFAGKYRELFGRTKYAYAHLGHLHHLDIKENNLMIVEQHRTLTAPDAYSSRAGFITGRDAQCITYHRDFGEVSRVKVSYDMLRSAELDVLTPVGT